MLDLTDCTTQTRLFVVRHRGSHVVFGVIGGEAAAELGEFGHWTMFFSL